MAQKVQVVLVDDLDAGEADETVSFSLDGVSYEIDLSDANAKKLRDALAVYVGSGRRVGGRSGARPGRGTSGGRSARRGGGDNDTARIREWARASGRQVSERGRISAELREAYRQANG